MLASLNHSSLLNYDLAARTFAEFLTLPIHVDIPNFIPTSQLILSILQL